MGNVETDHAHQARKVCLSEALLDNCQARRCEIGAVVNKVDRKAEARGGVSNAYQARLRRAHEAFLQGHHSEEFPKIPPRLEKDVVVVDGPLADADFSCPGPEADRTVEHVVKGLLIKQGKYSMK